MSDKYKYPCKPCIHHACSTAIEYGKKIKSFYCALTGRTISEYDQNTLCVNRELEKWYITLSQRGRFPSACPNIWKDRKMTIDDLIDQFTEDITFDALKDWCAILGVDYEEPPIDDMYPDWEVELRTEIAEAMRKVGQQ